MCVIQRGMRNGGPPLTADIAGQEHMLAYITPQEGGMLKAAGGAGKPGPMGIMSFFDVGEGDFGYDSGGNSASTAGGFGDPDGSSYGGDESFDNDSFSGNYGDDVSSGGNPFGTAQDIAAAYGALQQPSNRPSVQYDYVNEDTATMGSQFANRREAQKYADMVSKVPLGTSYGDYRTSKGTASNPSQQQLVSDANKGIRGFFNRLGTNYDPYSLNRQDIRTGAPRGQGGLTEAQALALSKRTDPLGKQAYEAHLAAKQGNVKDGAFNYVMDPDNPDRVAGYTHASGLPTLTGLMQKIFGGGKNLAGEQYGSVNEVYTGDSDQNPFDESNFNDNDGGDPEVVKKRDPCPEGYVYSEESNSCIKVETDEDGERGSSFKLNTEPFPDLSRYGRDGKGEYRFFSEMPGILNMEKGGLPSLKKNFPRQPTGEVIGPGGPKDDMVGPIALSNREYVEPYERVLDEGNGNYKRGIEVLEKKRHAALRKYRDRVKSENSRAA